MYNIPVLIVRNALGEKSCEKKPRKTVKKSVGQGEPKNESPNLFLSKAVLLASEADQIGSGKMQRVSRAKLELAGTDHSTRINELLVLYMSEPEMCTRTKAKSFGIGMNCKQLDK